MRALELSPRESSPFAGSLHFDQAATAQADDIDVDLGGRVFAIVEIEHRLARDDARADGRHAVGEDRAAGFERRTGHGPRRRRR